MTRLFPVIFFLPLLLISFQSKAQSDCRISGHYDEFITIRKMSHNDRAFLIKRVVVTESDQCFAPLVNNDSRYIEYLLTHFSSNENNEELLAIEDSIALRQAYFDDLASDSLFNSVMSELVNKTISGREQKDFVEMDALIDVAVKYFSINRIKKGII